MELAFGAGKCPGALRLRYENTPYSFCNYHNIPHFQGEAEAYAVEIKAKAETKEMVLKADAWSNYQKAAKVAMWMDTIPVMAAEVAAPLSQVKNVTMLGHTDTDIGVGPCRLTSEVMTVVESIPRTALAFTGSDRCAFLKPM